MFAGGALFVAYGESDCTVDHDAEDDDPEEHHRCHPVLLPPVEAVAVHHQDPPPVIRIVLALGLWAEAMHRGDR